MLDFLLIEKTIKDKNFSIKYFIPKVAGMTVQGFRKALLNKTLKLSKLEDITAALGLEMSYWWKEEPDLVGDGSLTYETGYEREIKKLNQELNRSKKTIDHLNDQIDLLKEKYGITEKKKEEKCG